VRCVILVRTRFDVGRDGLYGVSFWLGGPACAARVVLFFASLVAGRGVCLPEVAGYNAIGQLVCHGLA